MTSLISPIATARPDHPEDEPAAPASALDLETLWSSFTPDQLEQAKQTLENLYESVESTLFDGGHEPDSPRRFFCL